jgi:hypothetical protein
MKRDGVVNFIIRLIIKTMLFIQLFHNNRYIRFGDLSSMWCRSPGWNSTSDQLLHIGQLNTVSKYPLEDQR